MQNQQKTTRIKVPQAYFDFYLKNNMNIVQIGAGGTGSLLIPNLARFISAYNSDNNNYIGRYTIVDGDKVAKKNIVRQNFIETDIGEYKSNVLAKRYSNAFGINIVSAQSYITSIADMEKVYNADTDIIISCVDNNKTRKIISDLHDSLLRYGPNPIWIDSGNELLGGQVFIQGQIKDKEENNEGWTKLILVHPEIAKEDDKLPTELSCAERLANNEQSLAVNSTAATIVFNVISSLLRGEKVHYYEIDFTVGNSYKKKFLDDWNNE